MKNRLYLGLVYALAIAIVVLCSANVTLGQDVTATITGTVVDQGGAAVVGARVTAKSVERGTVFNDISNEAGIYRITQLPVGNYDLRVEKDGFQTSLYPAFGLSLNQIARIDVIAELPIQAIELQPAAIQGGGVVDEVRQRHAARLDRGFGIGEDLADGVEPFRAGLGDKVCRNGD